MKKNVYLDVCALCRSFDDQSYLRVRLETEAVNLILAGVLRGDLQLVISPVHHREISDIPDPEERIQILESLQDWGKPITGYREKVRNRAEGLIRLGLGIADAAHLAFAEEANAVFVSCDDKLLKKCRRLSLGVWTGSPIAFCEKENLR